MAPRKEKQPKVSGDEASDAVLDYLRKQNRPYSAIDVSANLHNKVSKAAAAKILRDLSDQNLITCRTSGKQSVFHALQPTPPSPTSASASTSTASPHPSSENPPKSSEGDLAAIAAALTAAHAEISTLQPRLRDLKRELAVLTPSPARSSTTTATGKKRGTAGRDDGEGGPQTEAALCASIAALREEKEALLAELEPLRRASAAAAATSGDSGDGHAGAEFAALVRSRKEEAERARAGRERWARVEAGRRRARAEMWRVVEEAVEGRGGDVAEVREQLGLDE